MLTVTQEDGSSIKMAQSRSILRYVGKFLQHEGEPLYPTDPVLAFKCDEVASPLPIPKLLDSHPRC